MELHDGQLCASLGHFVWSSLAVYCPHRQAWVVIVRAGDDADDQHLDHQVLEFGPFDSAEDVSVHLATRAHQGIRTLSRVWLDQRRRSQE